MLNPHDKRIQLLQFYRTARESNAHATVGAFDLKAMRAQPEHAQWRRENPSRRQIGGLADRSGNIAWDTGSDNSCWSVRLMSKLLGKGIELASACMLSAIFLGLHFNQLFLPLIKCMNVLWNSIVSRTSMQARSSSRRTASCKNGLKCEYFCLCIRLTMCVALEAIVGLCLEWCWKRFSCSSHEQERVRGFAVHRLLSLSISVRLSVCLSVCLSLSLSPPPPPPLPSLSLCDYMFVRVCGMPSFTIILFSLLLEINRELVLD